MIKWLDAPVNVTPGTQGAWTDVDNAAVPSGAKGVFVCFENNVTANPPGDKDVGVRKNGSTDSFLSKGYWNNTPAGAGTHHYVQCGVDASGIFEAYIQDTSLTTLWLLGYWEDDTNVVMLDNAVNKTPTADDTWRTVDIASDTGADTAVAAIITHYQPDGNYESSGVRKIGSTATDMYGGHWHNTTIVTLNGSEQFEARVAAGGASKIYLVGYLKGGWVDAEAVGPWADPTVSGAWASPTLADKPSGATDEYVAAVALCWYGATANARGLRHRRWSSWDVRRKLSKDGLHWMTIPLDRARKFDDWMYSQPDQYGYIYGYVKKTAASPYGGTALTHLVKADYTERTTTSTSQVEVTQYTIAWSDLTAAGFAAGDTVVFIGKACVGGASITALQGQFRVSHGTTFAGRTTWADGASLHEPASTTASMGHSWQWIKQHTLVDSENIYFSLQTSSTTARADDFVFVVIKLGGTGGLATDDYRYAETTPSGNASTTYTDGASVTLPGTKASSWAVLASCHWLCDSTSADALQKIVVGSSSLCEARYEGENTSEEMTYGNMAVVHYIGSDTTAKVQYSVDSTSTHDCTRTAIFALRLDAFESWTLDSSLLTKSLTALDTYVTLVDTGFQQRDSTARDVIFMGTARTGATGDTAKRLYGQVREGTNEWPATGDDRASYQHNGSSDKLAPWWMGKKTSVAQGNYNLNFRVAEDNDVSPAPTVPEAYFFAFVPRLAATTSGQLYNQALNAVSTAASVFVRNIRLIKLVTSISAAVIVKHVGMFRAVVAACSAVILLAAQKAMSATASATATLQATRAYFKELAGAGSGTVSIVRRIDLIRSAAGSGTATLARVLAKLLSMSVAGSGAATLNRGVGLIRSAVATGGAIALRAILKTLGAVVSGTVTTARRVGLIRSANSTGSATVVRAVSLIRSAVATGFAAIVRLSARVLSVAVSAGASLVPRVPVVLAASAAATAVLNRSLGKLLNVAGVGSAVLAGAATRLLTLGAGASATTAVRRAVALMRIAAATGGATVGRLLTLYRTLNVAASGAAILESVRVTLLNVAAGASATASLARMVKIVRGAGASAAASIAKNLGRMLAVGATASATISAMRMYLKSMSVIVGGGIAAIVRAIQTSLSADTSGSAVLTAYMTVLRMLATTSSAAAYLVRTVGQMLGAVAGAVASSARGIGRALGVVVSGTATIDALRVFLKLLSAAGTVAAVLSKHVGRLMSAVAAADAAIGKRVDKFLAALSASAGQLARGIGKTLTAATQPGAASVATLRVYLQAMSVISAALAVLSKSRGAALSAVSGVSASLVRSASMIIDTGATASAALLRGLAKTMASGAGVGAVLNAIRVTLRTMSAGTSGIASLIRQVRLVFAVGSTGIASLVRSILIGPLSTAVSGAAVLSRRMARTLESAVNSTASISTGGYLVQSLMAAASASATLARRVGKGLVAVANGIAAIRRHIAATLGASASVSGMLARGAYRVLDASVAGFSSLTAGLAQAFYSARRTIVYTIVRFSSLVQTVRRSISTRPDRETIVPMTNRKTTIT